MNDKKLSPPETPFFTSTTNRQHHHHFLPFRRNQFRPPWNHTTQTTLPNRIVFRPHTSLSPNFFFYRRQTLPQSSNLIFRLDDAVNTQNHLRRGITDKHPTIVDVIISSNVATCFRQTFNTLQLWSVALPPYLRRLASPKTCSTTNTDGDFAFGKLLVPDFFFRYDSPCSIRFASCFILFILFTILFSSRIVVFVCMKIWIGIISHGFVDYC